MGKNDETVGSGVDGSAWLARHRMPLTGIAIGALV
jgi:hypothetical protein